MATTRSGRIGRSRERASSSNAANFLAWRRPRRPGRAFVRGGSIHRARAAPPAGGKRELRIAQHRDLGRIGGARARRGRRRSARCAPCPARVAPALGGDRAGAAADEADEIGAEHDLARRHHAAIAADHAHGKRMVVGDRALAAHGGRDRRLESSARAASSASAPAITGPPPQTKMAPWPASASAAASTASGSGADAPAGIRRAPDRRAHRPRRPDRAGRRTAARYAQRPAARGHGAKRGAEGGGSSPARSITLLDLVSGRNSASWSSSVSVKRPREDTEISVVIAEHRDRGFVRLDHARHHVGGAAAGRPLAHPHRRTRAHSSPPCRRRDARRASGCAACRGRGAPGRRRTAGWCRRTGRRCASRRAASASAPWPRRRSTGSWSCPQCGLDGHWRALPRRHRRRQSFRGKLAKAASVSANRACWPVPGSGSLSCPRSGISGSQHSIE